MRAFWPSLVVVLCIAAAAPARAGDTSLLRGSEASPAPSAPTAASGQSDQPKPLVAAPARQGARTTTHEQASPAPATSTASNSSPPPAPVEGEAQTQDVSTSSGSAIEGLPMGAGAEERTAMDLLRRESSSSHMVRSGSDGAGVLLGGSRTNAYRLDRVSGFSGIRVGGGAGALKPPMHRKRSDMPIIVASWIAIGSLTFVLLRKFVHHLRRSKRQTGAA